MEQRSYVTVTMSIGHWLYIVHNSSYAYPCRRQRSVGRVISCVCNFVCLCVRPCRALNGKRRLREDRRPLMTSFTAITSVYINSGRKGVRSGEGAGPLPEKKLISLCYNR